MSDENEIIDDEIIASGETEEPPQPSYKEVLKKHNLDTRWKAEDSFELVDEMGKSYSNLEQALRQREAENAQMRNYIQSLQQSKPAEPKQDDPDETPEIRQAREFVSKTARGEFEKELLPLKQQLENANAQLYVMQRINAPTEAAFKDAVYSGELQSVMVAMNLPFTSQNVENAFNSLMYRKMSDVMAQTAQNARAEGADLERQKQVAFRETGGKSQRTQPPSVEDIIKATANMSEAETDAYFKKAGVKLPTIK